ncbi:hypothetical protein B0H13DRAFT_1855752 [Mycena leptocephala]|nr:hypothetical protein B0H13DRAFT_1855752 [Mycena leptocephala]
MPLSSTVTRVRLSNITASLDAALTTLELVIEITNTPFLAVISSTTRSLLTGIENVKQNKNICAELMEKIHKLLYAIIWLHTNSDASGELSPDMLHNIGDFAETLHKIHTFIEAQQNKSGIRSFFRQGEMNTLLKDCNAGLQQAVEAFRVQSGSIVSDVSEMRHQAQKAHQEVLEMIEGLSNGTDSERASSISRVFSTSQNSSSSLSLLPSAPKIFHGRELELAQIVQALIKEIPRIAILGAGGMGKTSLARAVLHYPETTGKYEDNRYFVACDPASTAVQLAALIASHVGLKPGKNPALTVTQHFTSSPPSLLILDNLETSWEPTESRDAVENFLSSLTDIEHLALIITMRGAERPANVHWTHPFLKPLDVLSQDAARQTFIDIADDVHDAEEVDQILLLADNMPLAINLLAYLVAYESVSIVLTRWKTERTALISEGHDKRSNLDLSISLSLASPRIMSLPQSKDLLSLLSIFPDGLSNAELLQIKVPIDDILACKAALLRTSLAYTDNQRRLKVLVPIQEYVQRMHPPTDHLVCPGLKYFQELLSVYSSYEGTLSSVEIAAQIQSNFTNIQNILMMGFGINENIVKTLYSACELDKYSRNTSNGGLPIMDHIAKHLPQPSDHRLEIAGWRDHPISNVDNLVAKALDHFPSFDDLNIKCKFYVVVSQYYQLHSNDLPKAIQFSQASLTSIPVGKPRIQFDVVIQLGWLKVKTGDYHIARGHAFEAWKLAKISGYIIGEATALQVEAICWHAHGHYSRSISLFTRARELLNICSQRDREQDRKLGIDLAEVHRSKSEYVEALNIQTQILQDLPLKSGPYYHALISLNIAEIGVEIGATRHDVQSNLAIAHSIFTKTGDSIAVMYCDTIEAALCLRDGNLLEARSLFYKCLKFAGGQLVDAITYCLERLGDICQWSPMHPAPSTWTIVFLGYALKTKNNLEILKALQYLGDANLLEGDYETALSLFTLAVGGFTEMDVHRSRAECMLKLGDIAKLYGDPLKAVEHWERARPLFERSSRGKQLVQIDERLAGNSNSLLLPGLKNTQRVAEAVEGYDI